MLARHSLLAWSSSRWLQDLRWQSSCVTAADFSHMTDGVASSRCDTDALSFGEIVSVLGHEHESGKSFRMILNPDTPMRLCCSIFQSGVSTGGSTTTLRNRPSWNPVTLCAPSAHGIAHSGIPSSNRPTCPGSIAPTMRCVSQRLPFVRVDKELPGAIDRYSKFIPDLNLNLRLWMGTVRETSWPL